MNNSLYDDDTNLYRGGKNRRAARRRAKERGEKYVGKRRGKNKFGKIAGIVSTITKNPIAKAIIGVVPGGGTLLTGLDVAESVVQKVAPGLIVPPKGKGWDLLRLGTTVAQKAGIIKSPAKAVQAAGINSARQQVKGHMRQQAFMPSLPMEAIGNAANLLGIKKKTTKRAMSLATSVGPLLKGDVVSNLMQFFGSNVVPS